MEEGLANLDTVLMALDKILKMKQINYSVIIPHYNCVSLLTRCLNSIPDRDDLEIIVVDDNSSIENRPQISRTNARVIYLSASDTHGAGHARNVGIMAAKGKWLLFADADDYYTENIKDLLNKYENDETTDLVYLSAQRVNENGNISLISISTYIRNYKKKRIYSEMVLRYNIWSPWTRMVKRQLVEQYAIFFENIATGNDMMFSLKCSKYAASFDVEEDIIYSYFDPIGRSETEKKRCKISNIKHRIELTIRQNELYSSVGYIFKSNIMSGLRNIPVGADWSLYKEEYKNKLREYNVNVVKDLYYAFVYRIGILMKILK